MKRASISFPAMILPQILAGEQVERIHANYGGDLAQSIRQLLEEHRELVEIEHIPAAAPSGEDARVRLVFGPPQEPLVNTRPRRR